MKVTLRRPWLIADLGGPQRVLSWALNRPGFVTAQHIVWREVRNTDLPPERDAGDWLAGELEGAGLSEAVCMLTARDVGTAVRTEASAGGVAAVALATAGLANAERVGHRRALPEPIGTINVAVAVSTGMTEGAMAEALSLVAEARSVAMLEGGLMLPSGLASGTGTDCIALAAPLGALTHAGKHTDAGEAIGRAAYQALSQAMGDWIGVHGRDFAAWV